MTVALLTVYVVTSRRRNGEEELREFSAFAAAEKYTVTQRAKGWRCGLTAKQIAAPKVLH